MPAWAQHATDRPPSGGGCEKERAREAVRPSARDAVGARGLDRQRRHRHRDASTRSSRAPRADGSASSRSTGRSSAGGAAPEWPELFSLTAPLRPQTYVERGLLRGLHPRTGRRCWSAGGSSAHAFPMASPSRARSTSNPLWAGDQDALNALLMSEIPEQALHLLPETGAIFPPDMERVEIVDLDRLACSDRRRPRHDAALLLGAQAVGSPGLATHAPAAARCIRAPPPARPLRRRRSARCSSRTTCRHGCARGRSERPRGAGSRSRARFAVWERTPPPASASPLGLRPGRLIAIGATGRDASRAARRG